MAKRKDFLVCFYTAFREVYDANPDFPRRGCSKVNSFTVTDSSQQTKCKRVPTDKVKTVSCFTISLHIHLRSGHFIARGTKDIRHGHHTMNMHKQMCLRVYDAET